MDAQSLKEYYNSMSDKDVAFSMGYVTYRNYMEQLKILRIDTSWLITKVDYSNLKARLKWGTQVNNNIINHKDNNIHNLSKPQSKPSILKKRKFRFPIKHN